MKGLGWVKAAGRNRASWAAGVCGAAAIAALLTSCATTPKRECVTAAQIVQMSQAGVPPADIIAKISASGTVYRLTASQLADLRAQGVSNAVIDYMLQTYLEAVRRDARYDDWSYWHLYDGYWYGGWPFGWETDVIFAPEREGRFPHAEERREMGGRHEMAAPREMEAPHEVEEHGRGGR